MSKRKNADRIASFNFTPESAPRQGRMKGSRNKLAGDFLYALQREFEQHGEEAIRIVRVEKPVEFLKVIASVLPKEFEIIDSRLKEIPDEELDAFIELARRRLAAAAKSGDGEEPPLN
jgi:hypothetical protein